MCTCMYVRFLCCLCECVYVFCVDVSVCVGIVTILSTVHNLNH